MRFHRLTEFWCLSMCFAVWQTQAADFDLNHKNSAVGINITNANAGVASWSVDGVNSLNRQGFYYRVGSGPELLVQSISSSPTVSFTQVPNVISMLDVTYASQNYSVRTVFQLTGGNAGSGFSGLSETITVKNLSSSILDFHLFQYSDFDLWGLASGQVAQYSFDALGQPYKVTQTDGTHSVTETLNANTAPIGHFEAALGNATFASLTDGAATVLNDNPNSGLGNATFAYQWNASLAANGGTLTISKLLNIVPEPTVATIFLVGIGTTILSRRRK